MSGALSRGRANEPGVCVRYTPCARSDKSEDDSRATDEDSDAQDTEISILRRHGSSSKVKGRGRGRGVGGRLRLKSAGTDSVDDDDNDDGEGGDDDDDDDFHDDRRDGGLDLRPTTVGAVASLASGDLELTECPHLLLHDPPGVGFRGSEGRGGQDNGPPTPGPSHAHSSSQSPAATANGPRHLPGLDLFSQGSERTKAIGERLSSTDKISLSSPIYGGGGKVAQQSARSSSQQSLLEIVSSKLDRARPRKRFSLAQGSLLKKPRLSEANVNVISSRVTRRQRRKDIEEKFGKRKSIRSDHHTRIETATSTSSDHDGCNWTFVFDPSGRLCYLWSSVVSVAFLYNFWVIIYRFAFQEIDKNNLALWFTLDYTADLLYVLDIAFHFRTGYLEDGVLQTDPTKLRIHYTNTTTFYIDCLCLLPLDFLYLSIGFCSILRGFRLVKVYRFWAFLDRTERHTNYPNVIRATTLMHYLIALFHWNACLYYIVASRLERAHDGWRFPKEQDQSGTLQYLHALHWSLITLTTIGPPPTPYTLGEYLFVIFELIFALVLFATFLGHIANIVTNVSAARKEFQGKQEGGRLGGMVCEGGEVGQNGGRAWGAWGVSG